MKYMKRKKNRYQLFLISPKQRYVNYPAHTELAKIFGKKRIMIPLALPTVAALTPDNYDIRIIDEEIELLPKNIKPDIVGISTLAATILRAYEIADWYRSMGIPVVFGGPYASFTVNEALNHADSVVIGEAENVWKKCLADFENGELKKTYKAEQKCEYKKQNIPRWDLVDTRKIFQVGVQLSRGCPFNCQFCLVTKIFGKKMRYRDIDNVIEEISSLPLKYIFFVDDNLTINKEYAKKLMTRLKPLDISWGCMASIDVAKEEELLKDMAEAGCFNILIGFESLNPKSLDETQKYHNKAAKKYEQAIRKIHAAGIHINASFVVGFDNDTLDEFDNIYNFTLQTSMPNVNLHILSATPGTELYERMNHEGRLYGSSHDLQIGLFPTMHYKNMSQIDMFDKYMDTVEKLFSFNTIRKKAVHLFGSGSFNSRGVDIGFPLKFRASMKILKEFIFTTDKDKRLLFKNLFSLILQKKLAIDKAAAFLLSMLSYNRHIKIHKANIKEYREIVKSAGDKPQISQMNTD